MVCYPSGVYIYRQISKSGGTSSFLALAVQGGRLASRNGDLLDNPITHLFGKEHARTRENRSGLSSDASTQIKCVKPVFVRSLSDGLHIGTAPDLEAVRPECIANHVVCVANHESC